MTLVIVKIQNKYHDSCMTTGNRLSADELADRPNAFAWRDSFRPDGFAVAFSETARPFYDAHTSDRDAGLRIRHIVQFVQHLATLDTEGLAEYRLSPEDLTGMKSHLTSLGFLAIEQSKVPDSIAISTQTSEAVSIGVVS